MKSKKNQKISLQIHSETIKSWTFEVFVVDGKDKYKFIVELEREYYQEVTNGKVLPIILVQESIFFLLEKEPVTSILKEFNLKQIQEYFPDFENKIRRDLSI